jgi:hypothetical protein
MNALAAECGYGRRRAIAACFAPTARCPVHRCRARSPARRALLSAARHKLWPTLRSNPRATGWVAEAAPCCVVDSSRQAPWQAIRAATHCVASRAFQASAGMHEESCAHRRKRGAQKQSNDRPLRHSGFSRRPRPKKGVIVSTRPNTKPAFMASPTQGRRRPAPRPMEARSASIDMPMASTVIEIGDIRTFRSDDEPTKGSTPRPERVNRVG